MPKTKLTIPALLLLGLCAGVPARGADTPPAAVAPPAHASGGIGDDDPLLAITGDYSLQLVFAAQGSGEYLADVKVLIVDAAGHSLLETVSPGPRFYVRLPVGSYLVRVEYGGKALQRSVTVGGRRPQSVYFHWPHTPNGTRPEGEAIMLDTLKEAGKNLGHEIGRAWEVVADGWRELYQRSSDALTHFSHGKDAPTAPATAVAPYPSWSLLAGEVEESDKAIVVRVELPGMEKSDCQVRIEGKALIVSGTKRSERISEDSEFHVLERAYGAFERTIPLPGSVVEEQAEASYRNGVLTVRLPKQESVKARTIPVS